MINTFRSNDTTADKRNITLFLRTIIGDEGISHVHLPLCIIIILAFIINILRFFTFTHDSNIGANIAFNDDICMHLKTSIFLDEILLLLYCYK